jgi:hypothetical protein
MTLLVTGFLRCLWWNKNVKIVVPKRCSLRHCTNQPTVCVSIPGQYKRRFRFEQEMAALQRQLARNTRTNGTNTFKTFEQNNNSKKAEDKQRNDTTSLETNGFLENQQDHSFQLFNVQERKGLPSVSHWNMDRPSYQVHTAQDSHLVQSYMPVLRAVEVGRNRKDIAWASQRKGLKNSQKTTSLPGLCTYSDIQERLWFVFTLRKWLILMIVRFFVQYFVLVFSRENTRKIHKQQVRNKWG